MPTRCKEAAQYSPLLLLKPPEAAPRPPPLPPQAAVSTLLASVADIAAPGSRLLFDFLHAGEQGDESGKGEGALQEGERQLSAAWLPSVPGHKTALRLRSLVVQMRWTPAPATLDMSTAQRCAGVWEACGDVCRTCMVCSVL